MAIIKVQKIPQKTISIDEILMQFCFYFPKYSFKEAKQLPYKRVILLLKIAQKENAKKMLELLNIVTAPHTKNGSGIKTITSYYQNILDN